MIIQTKLCFLLFTLASKELEVFALGGGTSGGSSYTNYNTSSGGDGGDGQVSGWLITLLIVGGILGVLVACCAVCATRNTNPEWNAAVVKAQEEVATSAVENDQHQIFFTSASYKASYSDSTHEHLSSSHGNLKFGNLIANSNTQD